MLDRHDGQVGRRIRLPEHHRGRPTDRLFNPVLLSPGLTPAFLDLQDAEQENTSLDARVRQVVILAVGAVWRSDYELYAHAAVAAKAGLPARAIQALAFGGVPDELSVQERLATRVARALSTGHRVEATLYQEAQAAFGPRGLVDIVYLAGCYHIVCGLLNAFEVPAPVAPAQAGPRRPKQGTLTTVALFPVKSFLENLAVRSDNSVLVTSLNARELFYVPPTYSDAPVEPVLLHRFDQLTTGLVEIEPDVFLLSASNLYTTNESFVYRRPAGISAGFGGRAGNGVSIPELGAGIERQLPAGARRDAGRRLLRRVGMALGRAERRSPRPGPGLAGARHHGLLPGQAEARAARREWRPLCRSDPPFVLHDDGKKLLMRVPVDPATLELAGAPELVIAGRMGDDFCLDEDTAAIYLTTHRQNSIDRISFDPDDNSGFPASVVGDPFTEALIGPCSIAWGRAPGEYGKVAYVISDGGTASPAPGGPLPARLQRVAF